MIIPTIPKEQTHKIFLLSSVLLPYEIQSSPSVGTFKKGAKINLQMHY